MKKRNPIAVVILSYLTFGIYYLYWLAATRKDLMKNTGTKIPTIWLMFAPFLAFLLYIPLFLILGTQNATTTTTYGSATTTQSGSVGFGIAIFIFEMIAMLAIVPITFYWTYKYSKVVDQYTNKEMSTVLTFILVWVLNAIGAAILQDKFNELSDARSSGQPLASAVPQPAGAAMSVPVPGQPVAAQPPQNMAPPATPIPPQPPTSPVPPSNSGPLIQ